MSDNVLSVTQLRKAYGPRVLFDDVTFALDAGDKVGLIGDNGTGKSTLLKILCGEDSPDSGTIALRAGVRIARLEQVPTLAPGKSARDVLAEPLEPLRDAIARYEDAAARVDPAADGWLHTIEQLGGWDWAHRVEKVASEVGLTDLEARVDTMSGGQQKRVALGRLLLDGPDIILLDEPTNHLDADTIEWLEAWIAKSAATIVVVTHDRYFLENAVDRMAELRDGRIRVYTGAYSDYLAARAEEEELRRRTGHRRMKMLESELEWARRSPKARTTKSRARLDRVDDLADEVKRLRVEGRRSDFSFDSAPRLGKTILELEHVTAGFEPGRPVIDDLTMMIRRGERLGIIGANGSGKTTLLRLVTGDLSPDSGRVVHGTQTRVAYFDQHRTVLEDGATVRETICPDGGDRVFVGGEPQHAVSWLERFGFGADAHGMRVGSLSGGERNRLALARFLLADANVILLDEPTNDLDLMTMHVLEEALLGFGGCALVVSHDRYFLDRVATTIVAFEAQPDAPARITVQPGDYTNWRRLVQADRDAARSDAAAERRPAPQQAASAPSPAAGGGDAKRLSYKERQELEAIEPRIEALEGEVQELEDALADPEVWADGATRGLELQQRREAARGDLERLYARWEDLAAREAATS